ncbi:hypothetical protein SEPL_435 [Salmonella phage SE_PL]|uniref:LamG-like jellyroll fold domain-containing protein n=1 Tax=Salmonella enterica TaxID=28901 RepID=UPI0011638D6C|nr:structural protein [Salmonella phage 7t3]QIG63048.1 hypothetical protein SEPL_435 [Salmonella phage SE_PL]
MIPFSRLLTYANTAPDKKYGMLMRAKDGFKDVWNPGRVITLNSTPSIDSTIVLPEQEKSFRFTSGFISLAVDQMQDLNVSKQEGDYTIEFYMYAVGRNTNNWYISNGTGVTGGVKIYTSNLYLQGRTKGTSLISSNIPLNVWTHVALVQSGTDVRLYISGSLKMILNGDRWGVYNTPLRIGGYETSANAYYDQIRISNSALYTESSITPPTYPFE